MLNHWPVFVDEIIELTEKDSMNIHLSIVPIVSLISGILILIMPKLLNYIIAIYLIAIGVIGLFGAGHLRFN